MPLRNLVLRNFACSFVALLAASSVFAADTPRRPFTVADSIEMTTLGDPEYWHHNLSLGRVAHYSPDETQGVIVLRRGNLVEGTTEYSLLHYRTDELFRAPELPTLLSMSSASNQENFASLQWLRDNRTLLFLSEQPGEPRQVFRFDTRTRELQRLTNSDTGVLRYSASADGAAVLYVAQSSQQSLWNRHTREHGLAISEHRLTNLILGREQIEPGRGELVLHAKGVARRIELSSTLDATFTPLLSPEGSHAVLRVIRKNLPASWQDYTDKLISLSVETMSTCEFVVLDVETGKAVPLLDAPQLSAHAGVDAQWSQDGQSVLVTPVHLPLSRVTGQERKARAASSFAAQITLAGEVRPLAAVTLMDLMKLERWDERGHFVALVRESPEGLQRRYFQQRRDMWREISSAPDWRRPPEIHLKEGMNIPPHLIAVEPSGREHVLRDLNPGFQNLTLARQEEIHWRATDGTPVRGGLYYPPNYVRGKRYPLVIQTHGWNGRLFAADGVFTSPFAAQALANKDMLVLQAWDFPEQGREAAEQRWLQTKINRLAMHQLEQSIYEGAIDHLDAAGLIDRQKVGIIGFSFTCWSVKYALSHPRPGYRYAAASVADGYDGGYFDYLVHGNQPASAQQFETIAGDKPLGAGLKAWLENAPGFNVDRVDTPLRMTPLGNPLALLSDWEWFVLLKRRDKPVDLVMVEEGTHTLVKSWDRNVVNGGNVDWFDFWLNGRKDPSADKADQYARWEKMRP